MCVVKWTLKSLLLRRLRQEDQSLSSRPDRATHFDIDVVCPVLEIEPMLDKALAQAPISERQAVSTIHIF